MGSADADGEGSVKGWGMGAALTLASTEDQRRKRAQQRRRQAGRYALEYHEAIARGWVETAARIRGEWQEWMAVEGRADR